MSSTNSSSQIEVALERIRKYFGTHVTKSFEWRKKQLEGLLRMFTENEMQLCDALKSDLGKPYFEAAFTEVIIATVEIKSILHELKDWMKPEKVPTPLALVPASSYVVREPFGVVLIIGPFNYPLMLLVAPLAAAIAAGNCAVLKPSELTPHTSNIVAKLFPKYLDPSAFAIIEGGVSEVTKLLQQRWDYIFFTGSENVGRIVMKAAAQYLTPVTLELGGKSPVIVHQDADIPLAARRIVWGKFLNAGQTCIAPDYIFVHSKIRSQFLEAVVKQIETFYGKDVQKSSDFARIVNTRHLERLSELLKAHKNDVLCGGVVDASRLYISPTILTIKSSEVNNAPIMKQEIFGPLLPILEYQDIQHVIHFINSRPKPLALYLFSQDNKLIDLISLQTSSGGLTINDCLMHYANSYLPFGGVGNSGLGSYHGKTGFDTFSHKKSVLHKSRWLDVFVRYPPYSSFNFSVFRYAATIYRVNSESFRRLFKSVFFPIIIAAVAHSCGVRVAFRPSRL